MKVTGNNLFWLASKLGPLTDLSPLLDFENQS